jgi:ATP phosphoribosyltransferase regulatory subunit|tara:strand:+ start:758 stop:1936 length:1179 start_codon:yes stop_codon:yes gene_type:complete
MSKVDRWLLPDGIEDVLPAQAKELEVVRRRLLDLFASWGYEFVIPPMVEFLESLLTGTGHDLDLKTFKVTDLVSGRTMGIRADMTPQVARIDAHSLNRSGPVRLCYAGTVLHSMADNMLASRTPIKVGAELFGNSDRESDLEIVSLMIESLKVLGVDSIQIELGDVSIFRQLVAAAGFEESVTEEMFALVQRKLLAELTSLIAELDVEPALGKLLQQLPTLCGDANVLERGSDLFAAHPLILSRLDNLRWITRGVQERFSNVEIYYDLSELRGYNYHTGIVFAAHAGSSGQAVAKGGRYDHIGEVFGRCRGATGFDVQLMGLLGTINYSADARETVLAQESTEEASGSRWRKIQALREEGFTVLESGESSGAFDFELIYEAGDWCLRSVNDG